MTPTSDKQFSSLFIFLILLWLYACIACGSAASTAIQSERSELRNEAGSATQESQHAMNAPSPEQLRQQLSVEDPRWNKNKPATISLRIENTSSSPIELKGNASFKLVKLDTRDKIERDRETFWCPVDVLSEKKSTRHTGRIALKLEKGQAIDVQLDLKELKWSRAILSDWPHKDLFAIVPPGEYKLHFEITITTGTVKLPDVITEVPVTKQIKSNEAIISLL